MVWIMFYDVSNHYQIIQKMCFVIKANYRLDRVKSNVRFHYFNWIQSTTWSDWKFMKWRRVNKEKRVRKYYERIFIYISNSLIFKYRVDSSSFSLSLPVDSSATETSYKQSISNFFHYTFHTWFFTFYFLSYIFIISRSCFDEVKENQWMFDNESHVRASCKNFNQSFFSFHSRS